MPAFGFPDRVNEVSARLVAGGVVVMCLTVIVFDAPWIAPIIAYGFVARVFAGPAFSPLAQLVTRVITPRLGMPPRLVPGPPKRFAQGMGAVISLTAVVLIFWAGWRTAGYALLGALAVAAALEALLALCLGCLLFAQLMRLGVIPEAVCAECGDLRPVGRPR